MVKSTLEKQTFLYHSYVKRKSYALCKRRFHSKCSCLSFISNFQICEKSTFNWVFLRQEIHYVYGMLTSTFVLNGTGSSNLR